MLKTKKLSFITGLAALSITVAIQACKKDEYKDLDCNAINASYLRDIMPIIQNACLNAGCHDTGSANGDFSSYTGLKGKANNGSLNKRVLEKKDMPSGASLSLDDRKKIKCWLDSGAPEN